MTTLRPLALAGVSIAAGCLTLAAVVLEVAQPGSGAGVAADVGWTAAGVCAMTGTLAAAQRRASAPRVRGAWLLFAAGSACWTAGAAIRDIQGTGLLTAPVAAVWIGFALCCVASFARRLPRLFIFGVFLLDAIPVTLLTIALARAIAPAPAGSDTTYHLLLWVLPALYVLLAANAVQMTGLHRDIRTLPASVRLFTFGFGLMALAALFWVPAALVDTTPQTPWAAPLWPAGLLAVGAAGLARARSNSRVLVLPPVERESGPHALPPTAAVLALIILLPFAPSRERLVLEAFLLMAALALTVRVYLMRREDLRMLGELVRSRHAAERAAALAGRSAERLRLLADLGLQLKSLVLDELLQAICDTAREVVGADSAVFGLASGRGRVLDRLVTSGLDEVARARVAVALEHHSGPLGTMLRPGTAPGPGGPAGLPPGHPFAGTFLAVPVPLDSPQRGALYLAGKAGGFDADDETLATLLAADAGHAIANAQLYSESRAQEEQLAVQNERLRDLDHMKDEFVALVSHELRTPLTSIIGYLELLRDSGPAGMTPQQRKFTDVIQRNSRRLLRLVGDLLFLSRIQSGSLALEFGETDVTEIVQHAIEEARPAAAAKDIGLTLSSQRLPALWADGTRLSQLAANLLSNSVKFTLAGGKVAVTLEREDDSAVLVVADTGIGIPADDQKHVFERFYRARGVTDLAIQGTGLGLTISKAIVDAHGGTIALRSVPGQGTTIVVRIPLRRAGQDAPADRAVRAGVTVDGVDTAAGATVPRQAGRGSPVPGHTALGSGG